MPLTRLIWPKIKSPSSRRRLNYFVSRLSTEIGATHCFISQQRITGIFQHDMAVFQHIAPFGKLQRLIRVLLDEEDGLAFATQLFDGIGNLLNDGTDVPNPVRCVHIPKPNGKT
jgi:hypothetical protein